MIILPCILFTKNNMTNSKNIPVINLKWYITLCNKHTLKNPSHLHAGKCALLNIYGQCDFG